jgi:GMP synthase-like glutamine amidotransferase
MSATSSSASFAPKGIILSGSHASTYEDHELRAPQAVWDAGVPVLGICYGMFTMTVQLGGQVEARRTASSATPRCGRTATPSC